MGLVASEILRRQKDDAHQRTHGRRNGPTPPAAGGQRRELPLGGSTLYVGQHPRTKNTQRLEQRREINLTTRYSLTTSNFPHTERYTVNVWDNASLAGLFSDFHSIREALRVSFPSPQPPYSVERVHTLSQQ